MARPANLVVAQTGGPTPVSDNNLRGIIEGARDSGRIGTVYGARHGIEGVLREKLLDLSAQPAAGIALLRYTPVAGSIGTCRYKLKSAQKEDLGRVIEVFRTRQIGYFLYIRGNSSMDTAHRIAEMAHAKGLDLVAVGVPKTIDNDVGDLGRVKDSFGRTSFGSSQTTVAQVVVNYLNEVGLAAKGAARGTVSGMFQRASLAYGGVQGGPEGRGVGGRRTKRVHGHYPAGARPHLQRPLRQGPAGRGGQQRADFPRTVDRPERDRRDHRRMKNES